VGVDRHGRGLGSCIGNFHELLSEVLAGNQTQQRFRGVLDSESISILVVYDYQRDSASVHLLLMVEVLCVFCRGWLALKEWPLVGAKRTMARR
jgi:hypothetical protein